jgi:hypothetical protein
MILRVDSKYPNRRTYVLKLARDATSEELRGRIENLVTLEHADFTSAIELCELLARDVDATGAVANSGG